MSLLSIDFESWARVPIGLGSYRYLTDPDTKLLMMAWAFDGEVPQLWLPGQPLPPRIVHHIMAGGIIAGWNSMSFERIAWREIGVKLHGFMPVADDQWIDTMLLAVAANMPRSLDACAKFVGAATQKDDEGHKLMLRLTSAKKTPDPSKISLHDLMRLGEYCKIDVAAEMATAKLLPNWPQTYPWPYMPSVDTSINDRGILTDITLVAAMQRAAIMETERMDIDMNLLTAFTYPAGTTREGLEKFIADNRHKSQFVTGVVPKVTNIEGLKDYLLANGVPLKLKDVPVDTEEDAPEDEEDEGVDAKIAYRLRKNDIVDLLAGDLPEHCRLALEMRLEAAKASAKKLKKILEVAGPDGRIRWQLKMFGAQQSGRFSGAGVQIHNFLRDCVGSDDHTEKVFEQIHSRKPGKEDKHMLHELSDEIVRNAIMDCSTGDPEFIRMMYGPVLPFISRMMRRTLCAPVGKTLIQGDYSAIEARMMSWLCQDLRSLKTFAEGGDIYRTIAGGMMGKAPSAITKEERQRGKVAMLAMGFQGGIGALVSMGLAYGMKMSRDEARPIVKAFRESNPELVDFGREIYNTAVKAVQNMGHTFGVKPLNSASFIYDGHCLHMNLPSGRQVHYWSPRLEGKDDYGQDILTCLNIKGKLIFRRKLWSGIFCENAASGSSVDLLVGALTKAEIAGLPIIAHVHDSMYAEVDEADGERLLPVFEECMLTAPEWTTRGIRLPIAADVHLGARFG